MIGLAWIVLIYTIFLRIDYHYRSATFVYSLVAVFISQNKITKVCSVPVSDR